MSWRLVSTWPFRIGARRLTADEAYIVDVAGFPGRWAGRSPTGARASAPTTSAVHRPEWAGGHLPRAAAGAAASSPRLLPGHPYLEGGPRLWTCGRRRGRPSAQPRKAAPRVGSLPRYLPARAARSASTSRGDRLPSRTLPR